MRILIADDSDVLLARLVDILTEIEGVEVVGKAMNLADVISAVEDLEPEVVILDIRMPGGNGLSALEMIKKRENPPVVVIFTNYPFLQYRKRSMDLGADFFFYKAIEFEKLVTLIKGLIEKQEQAS